MAKDNDDKPTVVEGTVVRTRYGNKIGPVLHYAGDKAPAKGSKQRFTMDGKTYSGIVAEAEQADGSVSVKFRDGFKPA